MVDPFSIADMEGQPQQNMFGIGQDTSSDLPELFKAWGVKYDKGQVLADQRAITRVRGQGNRIEESPVLLSFSQSNIDRKDALTAQLEQILLPFAGILEDETGEGLSFTPLLVSSESSGTVDGVSARFGGQAIRSSLKTKGVAVTVAARLKGTFKTAFPDGAPAADGSDEDEEKEEIVQPANHLTTGESTVIVIADADMMSDRFCVQAMNFFGTTAHQPINDNINLLANAAEQLVGSQDLIGIRSRGRFARPFDRVVALEEKARSMWQSEEDQLQERLQTAQRKINDLQAQKDESQRFILSPAQQQEIKKFRAEEIEIKHRLKQVRKSLRSDIERLGIQVKVANIALMPFLVTLGGISYGLRRRRRR